MAKALEWVRRQRYWLRQDFRQNTKPQNAGALADFACRILACTSRMPGKQLAFVIPRTSELIDFLGAREEVGCSLSFGDFLNAFASAEPSHDDYLLRWPLTAAEQGNLSSPGWWYEGSGWVEQGKLTHPSALAIPEGSNEFSVIWDSHYNKFLEVESVGFGASDIGIRWADRLEGPWSGPVKVYHPPESNRPDAFVYAGKMHVGLQGGDLVATYVANSMDNKILAKDHLLSALCSIEPAPALSWVTVFAPDSWGDR